MASSEKERKAIVTMSSKEGEVVKTVVPKKAARKIDEVKSGHGRLLLNTQYRPQGTIIHILQSPGL